MDNAAGRTESSLVTFGGLVAELNAPDVPAGSSPICCDCEFTVGSVRTRNGAQSVYAFSRLSEGPNGCNSGTSAVSGNAVWSSPGNITLNDGNYAVAIVDTPESVASTSGTAVNSGLGTAWVNPQNCFSATLEATSGGFSPYQNINISGLGFAIPLNAVVTGIQMSFKASIASGARTLGIELTSLSLSGKAQVVNSSTPQVFTLGGPNDLWGGSPSTVTAAGINSLVFNINQSGSSTATLSLNSLTVTIFYTAAQSSDSLIASQFSFSIPATPVNGIEIGITGLQAGSQSGPNPVLQVMLMKNGVAVGQPRYVNLGASSGRVVVGSATDSWGAVWAAADINNTQFGAQIIAANGAATTVSIDFVDCTVFQTAGAFNFDWVKTSDLSKFGGKLQTLALDSNGTIWSEDVINSPGTLTSLLSGIAANSFARSVTEDGQEFVVFSDLTQGIDIPRAYNGSNWDRISQTGPGAPPSIATSSTDYAVSASPNGVTQAAAATIRRVFWSSDPAQNSSPGNIITVFVSAIPSSMRVGSAVFLAGIPTLGGQNPNGTYLVTSIGTGQVNGSGAQSPYFTVVSTLNVLAVTSDFFAGGTFQLTLATVVATAPIPNLQVGNQFTLSGVGIPAWDATWTVLFTPNSAQLVITATSLFSGIATYTFTLVSGSLPAAGEAITINGTNNGNGIFNVSEAIIQSATGTQFTIDLNGPNVSTSAESGFGLIAGTKFQFDPGPALVGSGTSPIFGNSGGGTLAPIGSLGAGTRECVVMFETRNEYITGPSIPVNFTTSGSTTAIIATQIPIGPPNVIRRILAFTGTNGANFFYIPDPVTIQVNNQPVTYSATVINDNVSTSATFTFTDAVLLAGIAIDIPGNNLFEQVELGNATNVIAYANRLFVIGEQNKVQNFVNMSFDGGFLPGVNFPLGWTADAVNGTGGTLHVSPVFGNSYYIVNSSGTTQALWGMIEQSAFQDVFQAAIINTNETYGVRVTCRTPGGASLGSLNIDLFSASKNKTYGIFTLNLSAMTTAMEIFTGNLLTAAFSDDVPDDLKLRVYLSSVPNGADCEIDRIEVYPLSQPVLTTQLRASYEDNFEAFDDITGNLGVGTQNQQPAVAAFTLFDNLYVVRTRSLCSTSDNGTTEPDLWTVREISGRCGTNSPNGVDVGEGWALIAGLAGVYLFDGGMPTKIIPELDPLWKAINWKHGNTIWIRNDSNNRMMYIGVPIATPNQWMPNFAANANPASPNVVLVCNYKEAMTAAALESEGPVRLTFMGDVRTYQIGRKWSAWSISAAYADFIERADTTQPLFFCGNTGTGKIYEQVAGTFVDDDGTMDCLYYTYPFPKSIEAQELGWGFHELQASYMTMLLVGSGSLDISIVPDNLNSQDTDVLQSIALYDPPSFGDTEIPLNEIGNRFFVALSPAAPGDWFEVSRMVMTLGMNPWAPVRGSN